MADEDNKVESEEEVKETEPTPTINVEPDLVINFMNEVFEKDPDAIKGLIESRVSCNEDLMNHDTVQVLCKADDEGKATDPTVGILGVLNGLIGKHETGWGYMAAEFDEDGNLHRFVRTPQTIEKIPE